MHKTLFQNLTILFAEDDKSVLEDIGYTLQAYFKTVYLAEDGEQALELYDEHRPDIVLTDIRMPKLDGIELVKEIREADKTTPIVMVTAFSDEKVLLKAVKLYLFDYLVKPLTHGKLIDVLIKCVKEHPAFEQKDFMFSHNCRYSFDRKELIKDDDILHLTHQEILFIELLIERRSQVLSYEEIEYHVWKDRDMSKNAIKTLVKKLRSKLPDDAIKNIVGLGYQLHTI